jgi:hypothetical protein
MELGVDLPTPLPRGNGRDVAGLCDCDCADRYVWIKLSRKRHIGSYALLRSRHEGPASTLHYRRSPARGVQRNNGGGVVEQDVLGLEFE